MKTSLFKRMALLVGAGVIIISCSDDAQLLEESLDLQNTNAPDTEAVIFNQGSTSFGALREDLGDVLLCRIVSWKR